ncbi:MAG: endopeptidase La [Chitinophagales bacterium]|nr:endopeptidase La [Chitinophagales bacterium]
MFDNFSFLPMDEDVEVLPILTDEDDDADFAKSGPKEIPLLPLRNTVIFPGVVIPITVGRDRSLRAVEAAYSSNKLIGVIGQKDADIEEPNREDLYRVGVIAKVIKLIKMPDGSSTVIIQGKSRISIAEIVSKEPYFKAVITYLKDEPHEDSQEFSAMITTIRELATEIIKLSPNIPSEANIVLKNITKPVFLSHFIASNLNIEISDKQDLLEMDDVGDRVKKILNHLEREIQMLELKHKIQSKVRGDIEKQQRDYFLHQQMKTIQEELGGDPQNQEIERLRERAQDMKWSKDIAKVFHREIEKLERTNPAAADYSVQLNYLELLLDLPWGLYTDDNFDLKRAKKVLDQDHYGLDKIKDRIIEYLAVLKLKGDLKSPILCFVGPPGVGKTSLGKSIARALDRKHVRMSLGGLHDESEIRGHRKTYIGALPGRIIQSLKKSKSSNPVFILDEIDKVGSDFRGDPASALLEVLDPEQNHAFYDNYLELEYDLSKVMFIATANTLSSIHPALVDRMEVIQLDGYSVEEKVEIAKKHLIPKQRKAHGLKAGDLKFQPKSLIQLIEDYTRESGVRELDRVLAAIMRNIAKSVAMDEEYSKNISEEKLNEVFGPAKYDKSIYSEQNPPGVAVGLAYTRVGGDILFIESSLSKGKGDLTLTGNLGDVMKESATTALSYLKAHGENYGIDPDAFKKLNTHVHVPEGAVPKDGPSAGVTLLTALASVYTQRKVKPKLAMTGEITLRGRVLPVGGIKEKILAAKRAGMKEIIMCQANEKDLNKINKEYIKGLKFHFVQAMDEVIDIALEKRMIADPLDIEFLAELK